MKPILFLTPVQRKQTNQDVKSVDKENEPIFLLCSTFYRFPDVIP